MMRGNHKCIVMIQNKGEDEDTIVAPDFFDKSFAEIGTT